MSDCFNCFASCSFISKLLCVTVLLAVTGTLFFVLRASAQAEPSSCPYDIHLSVTYDYLTPDQRLLYDRMYDALRSGQSAVSVPQGVSRAEAEQMLDTIYNEAAELCAYSRWESRVADVSGGALEVQLAYKFPLSVQEQFINEIASLARSFSGQTPYAGIEAIHDYLIRRFVYDTGWSFANDTELSYFALKDNKAVCNGYAQTLAMLGHFAGYTCSYIDGSVYGDDGAYVGQHAWNVACVDGRFLWYDATWDDAGSQPLRKWFALDGAEMARTHKPDAEYSAFALLKSYLPEKLSWKLYLDVNDRQGFVRGASGDVSPALSLSQLKAGEYYAPALVLYNEGQSDFPAIVSYRLEGQTISWGEYRVPAGSNLAFRTLAAQLRGKTGAFAVSWYVNGIPLCVCRWTVS